MKHRISRLLFAAALSLISFQFVQAQAQYSDAELASTPHWVEMMQDQDVNFFEVQRAFNLFWEGREVTKGSGWKPFKRWEYWMGQRVSPDGTRPAVDRDLKAWESWKQNNADRSLFGDWEPLGPFTVPSGYNGYRGLGRLNAIAFHPTDPNVLFVGAPAGGLWITHDHGQTWETYTDVMPTLGVSAIVVDYSNPDIVYIGTGDRDAGDAPGHGVWKSVDGGQTFTASNSGMGNTTVGRMIMHPADPSYLLAATSSGVFKSTNNGASWTSTANGNFKEIVFKSNNPSIVYAASGGTFYRSTDGGNNFTVINEGLPGGSRGVIGVSPASPDVVYFLITNGDSFKGIYRSTDAGLSFTTRSTTPNIMSWGCNGGSGGQAWYDLDMSVDPTNADIIHAGGVNNFKSTNGGQSWSINSHWWGDCGVPSVHADLHILEYSPINNRLYVGNDGGFYWTANGGTTWTEISNGLVISQAYKIGQSLTDPGYVINGYQDNGTSTLADDDWIAVNGGDGMECAFDPTDERYSYSTLYYGPVYRHFNHSNQGQIAGEGSNGITEGGAWVTPFIIDHINPNVMFIGYKNVWRSTNIKAGNVNSVSWTKISTMSSNNMSVLAQSRANTDILYAASGNRFYRTDNAKASGVQWTTLTGSLPVSNSVTAIETSPFDENVVYIAQQNLIYKSTDKGQTWQNMTANLPNVNFNSIAYYKNSNEGLYLGTDIGIFYRDASMSEWISYSDGFPASGRVTEIEIYYDAENPSNDVIRAGTYGRGLWSSPPYYGTLEANFEASTTQPYANCGISFTDLTSGVPYTWEWNFEGGTPSVSTDQHPQNIVYSQEGVYSVTLTVTNPVGSDTKTIEDYVVVGPAQAPQVNFMASDTEGCSGLAVLFTDLSEICPDSWLWSFSPDDVTFANGTSATSQNPEVIFNLNTTYDVTLTATNQTGSSSLTFEKYVSIGGVAIPMTETFASQSFEEIGWDVENPDNGRTWETKTTAEGRTTAWMNYFNYTSMTARDYLITKALNFGDYENVYLSFDYAYTQRFTQKDSLIISISSDCGQNWQRIYADGPDDNGRFITAAPTMSSFEPANETEWCSGNPDVDCPVIDLSAWAGMANIKLRFESYNQFGNNLYLGDVQLTVVTATNAVNQELSGIQLYPVPADKLLNVTVSDQWVGKRFTITDLHGRILSSGRFTQANTLVQTAGWEMGIYLLKVEGNARGISKILIMH